MPSNPSGCADANGFALPVRAERSFVGAVISGAADAPASALRSQDLSDPFCQRVYIACEGLIARGRQPDYVTLLDEHAEFDPVALDQLISEGAMDASLIDQHIRSIREASNRRKFAAVCAQGSDMALRSPKPLSQTLAAVTQVIDRLSAAVAESMAVTGTDALVELDGWLSGSAPEAILSTGIPSLDATLGGGLRPGRLLVIGARPGVGKSALLSQIALRALADGRRVLYVSLEMGEREVVLRMMAHLSGVPCDHLERRALTQEETLAVAGAYGRAMPDNLFLVTGASTPAAIRAEAMRLQSGGGLDLICVDYLQLMGPDTAIANRAEAVGAISRALKRLAMELRCPIAAASQVNRSSTYGEERPPRLSELRESGSIEQDADAVLLLHCPQGSRTQPVKAVELAVAKNRQGALAAHSVLFDAPHMRFCDAPPRMPH